MEPPVRPDLTGWRAFGAGTCYQCGGPLIDSTGTYSEMAVIGWKSFAACVCNACKRREREELNADKMARTQEAADSKRISARKARKASGVDTSEAEASADARVPEERVSTRRPRKAGSK